MIPNVSPHRLDVRNLAPHIALAHNQLAAKEIDLSLLREAAHHLMVRRGNDFHFMKPCASHNGIVWEQIVDHWELYVQGDWVSLNGQHNVT